MTYLPLVIIGAARSGTNILRDTLTSLPEWSTWPCDEINLIWRHGNIDKADDVLAPADATPKVRAYIRKAFDRQQARSAAEIVVEKTCANSLRVPFVDAILPEARYIYIVRDGRDAALSASKRWVASVEPEYLLKKLRFVPMSDVPHYARRFLQNRQHQRRSQEKRQASWGPRFPGIGEWVRNRSLIDVCAEQWAQSVAASDAAFATMPDEKVISIRYEEFVRDPKSVLRSVETWAGRRIVDRLPPGTLENIRDVSAGAWRKKKDAFSAETLARLQPILTRHDYAAD